MEAVYQQLITDMSRHAQKDYPLEACGIITTDFKYIPCKNFSPKPKISFILDPIALLDYEDNLWGIFHSHPGEDNPLPSENDMASTIFDELRFFVGFAGKVFIYWFDTDLQILRYEPFEAKHLAT